MSHRRMTKIERQVKGLILQGNSRSAVARQLAITRSRVNKIVGRLVHYGELRAIPGTQSPVIYEDPNYCRILPPTGVTPEKSSNTTRLSDSDPSDDADARPIQHVLDSTGISTDRECPDGYVEAHLNGGIRFTVDRQGDLEDIHDRQGLTIGYWSTRDNVKGAQGTFILDLRLWNQVITAQFRIGNAGNMMFMLYPSRLYLDPSKFRNQDEAGDAFIDRANYISDLLTEHGWQIHSPQIRGTLEYAIRDHPLMEFLPQGQVPPGSDVFIDTSKGVPEVEMKDITDWEKVRIWANAPSEILNLNRKVESAEIRSQQMEAQLQSALDRLAMSDAILDKLTEITQKQEQIIESLVNNTTRLIQIGSNLTSSQMMAETRSVETASTQLDDQKSSKSQKPKQWEGYV